MSDTQDTTTQDEAEGIARLREKAKQADQVPVLERKIALLEAGIPAGTALGDMFAKSYDGELDRDSIRAAALEVGLIDGEGDAVPANAQPDPDPQSPEIEQASIRDALIGGDVAGEDTRPPDAVDAAFKAFEQAKKEGLRSEAATVVGYRTLIEQAAQGNPTALFNEQSWLAKFPD